VEWSIEAIEKLREELSHLSKEQLIEKFIQEKVRDFSSFLQGGASKGGRYRPSKRLKHEEFGQAAISLVDKTAVRRILNQTYKTLLSSTKLADSAMVQDPFLDNSS
jgi:hypothetical protein